MNEYASLLAGVVRNPHAALPRLVLADWLDEAGRADEAGLIRTAPPWHKSSRSAAYRAWRGLLARHRYPADLRPATVFPVFPKSITGAIEAGGMVTNSPQETLVEVRDGFVTALACPWALFRRHAREWFARNPITAVIVTDRSSACDDIRKPAATWSFFRSWTAGQTRYSIDPAVYARLTGYEAELPGPGYYRRGGLPGPHRCYPDPRAAHVALSAATVSLGRAFAGLPPCPPAGGRDSEGVSLVARS